MRFYDESQASSFLYVYVQEVANRLADVPYMAVDAVKSMPPASRGLFTLACACEISLLMIRFAMRQYARLVYAGMRKSKHRRD